MTGEIESGIFRMSGRSITFWLFTLYGKPWLAAMSVLTVVMALAALTVDIRWGLVCLMLIFILFPMAIAFLYYYHALRPVTAMNILFHRIRIGGDGVSVDLFEKMTDKDTGEETFSPLYSKVIPSGMFRRYKIGTDSVSFPLEAPGKGFLCIPADAFADKESFSIAVERLAGKRER